MDDVASNICQDFWQILLTTSKDAVWRNTRGFNMRWMTPRAMSARPYQERCRRISRVVPGVAVLAGRARGREGGGGVQAERVDGAPAAAAELVAPR